jgi:2-polyprenyl-3-methyl-5-hydroxy-6-metoxy-1,4-benzoquinol methylase
MDFAVNYHQWILDGFRPFLGKRLVEIGAGSGGFSEMLAGTGPEWLIAVEPSENMYPLLAERLKKVAAINNIARALHGTLADTTESIRQTGTPDSVIYVNVLEHIEDDALELRTIHSLLQPGGHVLIFVPAHSWLMGSMDHQLGHYRRYTVTELVNKCLAAGFTIRQSGYFDILGVAPWWVMYCLLRSKNLNPGAVRIYDRYVVAVSRFLQRVIRFPIGKNVILVAQKQPQGS